jgi:hypothetical protein
MIVQARPAIAVMIHDDPVRQFIVARIFCKLAFVDNVMEGCNDNLGCCVDFAA